MSYILDALRKSERERVLGHVPTLSTAEIQYPDHRKKAWWWLILALAAVIAVVIFFPDADSVPESTLTEVKPSSLPQSAGSESGVPPQLTVPGESKRQQQIKSTVVPNMANSQVEIYNELESTEAPGLPPDLAEFPNEYRKKLPDMELNVISYSEDPKRRFVMIDLQMYREGQRVKAGPRLEQIHADGAVLSYAGKRFMLRP